MSGRPTNATQALLRQAFPPLKAQTIFEKRIQHKPLLLHGTVASSRDLRRSKQLRKQQRNQPKPKRKPAPLSAREKRALHIHEIPPEARKYAVYEPLHRLWVGYMHEILGPAGGAKQTLGLKLASADYHGARLEVVRSRCPSRVGVTGICVKETKAMFYIITEKDLLKEIPKEHTVFRFEVPAADPPAGGEDVLDSASDSAAPKAKNMVFELHGSQFGFRAGERAGRKFKQKPATDL